MLEIKDSASVTNTSGKYAVRFDNNGFTAANLDSFYSNTSSGTVGSVKPTPAFRPVTSITMTSAASVQANTQLTLAGTVAPSNATNTTILWSLVSAGTTGATVASGVFNATAAGTATVRATVTNGLTASSDFTADFQVTVTAAPGGTGGSQATPKTGDQSSMMLWVLLAVLALVGVTFSIYLRTKKQGK